MAVNAGAAVRVKRLYPGSHKVRVKDRAGLVMLRAAAARLVKVVCPPRVGMDKARRDHKASVAAKGRVKQLARRQDKAGIRNEDVVAGRTGKRCRSVPMA